MYIFDQLICVTVRPIIHLTVMAGSAMVSTTSVCWGENFITDFVYLKHLINIDGWRYDLVLLLATVIGCLGNLLMVIILCKQQLGSKFEIKFLFSSFDWARGRIANGYRLCLFLASTRDRILALIYSKGTLKKEDKYSLNSDVFTWYDEMFHNSHIIIQVKQHEWFWSSWQ